MLDRVTQYSVGHWQNIKYYNNRQSLMLTYKVLINIVANIFLSDGKMCLIGVRFDCDFPDTIIYGLQQRGAVKVMGNILDVNTVKEDRDNYDYALAAWRTQRTPLQCYGQENVQFSDVFHVWMIMNRANWITALKIEFKKFEEFTYIHQFNDLDFSLGRLSSSKVDHCQSILNLMNDYQVLAEIVDFAYCQDELQMNNDKLYVVQNNDLVNRSWVVSLGLLRNILVSSYRARRSVFNNSEELVSVEEGYGKIDRYIGNQYF
jgi:hypothetical protein